MRKISSVTHRQSCKAVLFIQIKDTMVLLVLFTIDAYLLALLHFSSILFCVFAMLFTPCVIALSICIASTCHTSNENRVIHIKAALPG